MARIRSSERTTLAVVALGGLAIWFGCAAYAGKTEAWDGMTYFYVGIPLMLVLCFWAGTRHPSHPVRFGLAVVVLQYLGVLATSGLGPIAIVGLAAFLGLAAMGAFVAWLGSRATSAGSNSESD